MLLSPLVLADSSKGSGGAPPDREADADKVTLGRRDGESGSLTALYVTGPTGGKRLLVAPGSLVRIGRAADSTVVVDHPRVSRSHAAIHLDDPITLSDLGSINGTFVGGSRLSMGEARILALGETFRIGDSTFALRPSGLEWPSSTRWVTLDHLAERLTVPSLDSGASGEQKPKGFALLNVRALRPGDVRWVEAILAELLTDPTDWLLCPRRGEIVLGLLANSSDAATPLERAALERLGSWGITATVESRFVALQQEPSSGGGSARVDPATKTALEFLRGSGVVNLRRGTVVVRDPVMHALRLTLGRIAPTTVSVLVLGETGVGKDVVASMLHELSPRGDQPFLRINCASLPEPLLESELFGHERGAFTGAVASKPGLLEQADGGTVFLDEIGDLALQLQGKLLHAIESHEITRVGGLRSRKIDVRYVSATNRPLADDVKEGRFRRDLFHRLNGVTVNVPALRERPTEIEPLAQQFLADAGARFHLSKAAFSPACIAALQRYSWPGNVRELRNIVERALLLSGSSVIEPHHLGLPESQEVPPSGGGQPSIPPRATQGTAPLEGHSAGAESERVAIENALNQCGGNQSRAAELLGVPRRTLVRKIAKLGLPRPRHSDR